MNSTVRMLLTIFIFSCGLVGLAGSLCGTFYTVGTLLSYLSPVKGDDYRGAVFFVSVPSMLIGTGAFLLARRRWRQLRDANGSAP